MEKDRIKLKADLQLLLAAAIWGFAFVAQRHGMKYVTPFFFNAVRFLLAAVVIFPLIKEKFTKEEILTGLQLGVILFTAANLQQVGIVHTTAGKAGFITGMYIVFVPIIGSLGGENSSFRTWLGVASAVIGLYFMSIKKDFTIETGDSLVLMCAFVFAVHVRMVGKFSRMYSAIKLAFLQYLTVGLLSVPVWIVHEQASVSGWEHSIIAILYGGVLSAGIAYTLQIHAQRHAPAADCAIILSLEGAFAGIGGFLILGESFSLKMLAGASLMLTGAVLAALPDRKHV